MTRALLALISGLIVFHSSLTAQTSNTPALDAKARAEVIDALIRELNRAYVFPDKATALERELRGRRTSKAYDAITDAKEFARILTRHMLSIANDRHLRVDAGPQLEGPPRSGGGKPVPVFGEARRLDGNIAYVQINSFGALPAETHKDARRIMSAAADAAALIIDLRANGGGRPETIALISSYVFGNERVQLNSIYWRPQNRIQDFYTDPKVKGKKFGPTKPVYVLTSIRTFSAAEAFAYDLQARRRAIIVGETTGGGAHPGGTVDLPHGMRANIPSGRAINPITKTNWEGVGVKPDVAAPSEQALDTAHKLARDAVTRGRTSPPI